jgi:diguanylate cyclase (GGDEF)-like protein
VADYLRTLTAGDYGTAYVEYRRRIGAVHHRVGINIEWYLGAYAHLLRAIQPVVQATAVAPDERAALWDALLAVVFFDIGLTLECYTQSYWQSEAQRLRSALEGYQAELLHAQAVARLGCWRFDFQTQQATFSSPIYTIFDLEGEADLVYPESLSRIMARIHPDDRPAVLVAWQRTLQGQGFELEHRVVLRDGSWRWVYSRCEVLADSQGRPSTVTGIVQDITARKAAEARIERLAFYDELTGLPNRTWLLQRLHDMVSMPCCDATPLTLQFLDLDGFREINDAAGHAIGDQILREVAQRLLSVLGSPVTLARMGGDEFAWLQCDDPRAIHDSAQRVIRALSAPVMLDGRQYTIGASIGLAHYPQHAATPEALLMAAETAMYHAKDQRCGWARYDTTFGARAQERHALVERLQRALQLGGAGLSLHYQPLVRLSDGTLAGAEALLRWHDPEWGWVSPAKFIPVAEERGLMVPLSHWVLSTACEQWLQWQRAGHPLPGRLAINVSARQFDADEGVERLLRLPAEQGVPAQALEWELTESAVMRDPVRAGAITERLVSAGYALAIDDFGTGYSSLAYLKRFAVSRLKIDRAFVNDMLADANDRAIVRAIVAMADELGLEVLAEGVEQPEQAQVLRQLGVALGQGYHWARPLDAQAFEQQWLRRPPGPSAAQNGTAGFA